MKNTIKNILLLLCAAFSLSSCDDWLNKTPESKLTVDSYFETETDLKMFSNSFYSTAFGGDYHRNQSDVIIESTLSDLIRGGNSRNVPNSGGGWNFTWLRKINTLIEYAPRCEDKDAVVEYTAVAKFFRAWYYYSKVRIFGDYPWIDHVMASNDADLQAPRDSREIVLTHMIEDVDSAIVHLPETSSLYRINKYTAYALKARFCLFEGTYRKYHEYKDTTGSGHDAAYYLNLAAEAAQKIMDSGKYSIYSTGHPDKDYVNYFKSTDAIEGETILAVDYDKSLNLFHDATCYGIQSAKGRAGFTKKFVNSYLMKDGSRFTDQPGWKTMTFTEETKDRDPRLSQTMRTPGYIRPGKSVSTLDGPDYTSSVTAYQTIKYLMDADAGADSADRSYNDMPVIRYAEILLIYAEAKAELGTLTQADLDKSIKLIRDRVGMPNINLASANANPDPYLSGAEGGYVNVTGANKGVILEIRRERTIELVQEGSMRYLDLMRWKEGQCLAQNFYGIYFPSLGEYDLDGDGVKEYCLYKGSKPTTSAKYVFEVGEGKDMVLTNGDSGYIDAVSGIPHVFDEGRDYLYPVPINERSLNRNLTQNPGWDDGLDF